MTRTCAWVGEIDRAADSDKSARSIEVILADRVDDQVVAEEQRSVDGRAGAFAVEIQYDGPGARHRVLQVQHVARQVGGADLQRAAYDGQIIAGQWCAGWRPVGGRSGIVAVVAAYPSS